MHLNAFPILVIQQNQYILEHPPTKQQLWKWLIFTTTFELIYKSQQSQMIKSFS